MIRVRRGTHLPPELVAEMKSCLDMLRAVVKLTTTVEQLREFIRKCEDNARAEGLETTIAKRWRELAARTSETGALYLEEADALTMEKLGERAFRVEEAEPGEGWPAGGPALPGLGLQEVDRSYVGKVKAPQPRPASALRSLGALLRAFERGDLQPKERRDEG